MSGGVVAAAHRGMFLGVVVSVKIAKIGVEWRNGARLQGGSGASSTVRERQSL